MKGKDGVRTALMGAATWSGETTEPRLGFSRHFEPQKAWPIFRALPELVHRLLRVVAVPSVVSAWKFDGRFAAFSKEPRLPRPHPWRVHRQGSQVGPGGIEGTTETLVAPPGETT